MFSFAINSLKNQYNVSRSSSSYGVEPRNTVPYTESERNALALGYREVADDRAFNRRYFIKDGKKWIHNLESLRRKLNDEYSRFICDEELEAAEPEGFGYDVEAYYCYNFRPVEPLQQRQDFQQLMQRVLLS